MQVFVDYVDPWGVYTSAAAACTVDPSLPVGVLTAVVFLSAVGQEEPADNRRVFHVESGRFLAGDTLQSCDVQELDTLVIVNTDDELAAEETALLRQWWAENGPARRCGRHGAPRQWC